MPSTKAMDKQLAILQALFLDTLAPLTSVLEALVKGEFLKGKDMFHAVTTAVKLTGNTNTHIAHLHREQVVNALNKSLLPVTSKLHSPGHCLVQNSPKKEKK